MKNMDDRQSLLDELRAAVGTREEELRDLLLHRAIAEIEELREVLVTADGLILVETGKPFIRLYQPSAPQCALIERAGCHPREPVPDPQWRDYVHDMEWEMAEAEMLQQPYSPPSFTQWKATRETGK